MKFLAIIATAGAVFFLSLAILSGVASVSSFPASQRQMMEKMNSKRELVFLKAHTLEEKITMTAIASIKDSALVFGVLTRASVIIACLFLAVISWLFALQIQLIMLFKRGKLPAPTTRSNDG